MLVGRVPLVMHLSGRGVPVAIAQGALYYTIIYQVIVVAECAKEYAFVVALQVVVDTDSAFCLEVNEVYGIDELYDIVALEFG